MSSGSPPPVTHPETVRPVGRRGLLTEHISRQLEQDIRAGRLPVGAKLPSERELAAQFKASRNVIREVLGRLEAKDLIDVAPGRGSFVAEQTWDQVRGPDALFRFDRPTARQLIEARVPIEVETAGLAAQRAGDDEIDRIARALHRIESAHEVVDMARADVDFHNAIAQASGNPVLRGMLTSISGLMFEMMLRSNSDPSIGEPGVPHHTEILEAIRARDAAAAQWCMREHLRLGLRTYGADLDIGLDLMASRHIEALLDQTGG